MANRQKTRIKERLMLVLVRLSWYVLQRLTASLWSLALIIRDRAMRPRYRNQKEREREKERIWSDQGLTRSTIRPRQLLKHCSRLTRRSTRLQRKPVTKATMLTPLIELRIRDCAARNTKVDKTRRDEWENGLIPTNNPRPKRCSYDRGITSSSLVIRVIQILHVALPRFSIVAVHAALRKSIFLTNSQEEKIAAS